MSLRVAFQDIIFPIYDEHSISMKRSIMSPGLVAIIILNWNGMSDTIECLQSITKITYPNYKIVVVDNASEDGSCEVIRDQFPQIQIIKNASNLGFAEGSNVGIRHGIKEGCEYILLPE